MNSSIIPKDSLEGIIEVFDISKVLTLNEITRKVTLQPKIVPKAENQTWTVGPEQKDGWRIIQHSTNEMLLTSAYASKAAFLKVEPKGKKYAEYTGNPCKELILGTIFFFTTLFKFTLLKGSLYKEFEISQKVSF